MTIPLLSPKPFAQFTAQEYHSYIQTLYREPPKAEPPADFTVRLNAKGNPVIRINRKPKFLTAKEIKLIAEQLGWKQQTLWLHIVKKKIEIKIR